jgi:hypothetical protein
MPIYIRLTMYTLSHMYIVITDRLCATLYLCHLLGVNRLSYIDMTIYMSVTMYMLSHIYIVICHILLTFCIRGEQVILCRHKTSPEDILGMMSAVGILTMRGGMTSHAAVICRYIYIHVCIYNYT